MTDVRRVLGHPDDVVSHPNLTAAEKREILASWASDAHAVVDTPGLRQLDSGAVVHIDDVLQALRALDAADAGPSRVRRPRFERHRRSSLTRLLVSLRRRDDDDDDDDPPPSPAAVLPLELVAARRRKWEASDSAEPVAA